MRTLVLGGYGNFGARLCHALAAKPGIDLIIAGRDAAQAAALASKLQAGAGIARLDGRAPDFAQQLSALHPDLVIHAAGPFQGQSYAVPLAAASAGAHYLDLADDRRFVCDFPLHLDRPFRDAGRLALSGASTLPALSSAVVEFLARGWQRIDSIETCIAPAQTAPRGLATMSAVLSYCGAPVRVWRQQAWQRCRGWEDLDPVSFARLRPRLGSVCDVPDLELFPSYYRGVQTVLFRAALEIRLAQRALSVLAKLHAGGAIARPARLAGLLARAAGWMDRFGSANGGMVVSLAGQDATGQPVTRNWHITAPNDHGPEIPCMASILLAERFAAGHLTATGAFPCIGWLSLEEFAPLFAQWDMHVDVDVDHAG